MIALSREYEEIDVMRAEFAARRTLVAERVNDMPLAACLPPEGLALMPGVGFGPSGEGHLRLSLSSPRPVLDDACARLARFLGTL